MAEGEQHAASLILSLTFNHFFHEYYRSDIMPGASEAELIEHLRRVYDELNDNLLEKIARGDTPTFKPLDLSKFDPFEDEQPTSTVSSPARSPGRRKKSPDATIAEAVLFGHMAEVLCTHEKLATILTQYEGLLSFFQFMCSTFFTVPYAHTVASGDDSLGWKVRAIVASIVAAESTTFACEMVCINVPSYVRCISATVLLRLLYHRAVSLITIPSYHSQSAMDAILNNRFFQATGSERIRQCLLHGAAIPCTKPASTDRETGDDFNLRGGRSSSLFDGDIYPEHESVADDSNPLAHHPAASPPPKLSVSTTTSTAAALVVAPKDPYAVHDYPTVLGNVRLDLSLSADWRRAYQSLASVFGTTKAVSVKANDDGKSSEAGKDGAPVHTVTLGGVTMLLAVAGSFAGYGYYVSRKKR